MAKKKNMTTAEEIVYLETEIGNLKTSIMPLLEELKETHSLDRHFCGLVGDLFSHTSQLGGLLGLLDTAVKTKKLEDAGII